MTTTHNVRRSTLNVAKEYRNITYPLLTSGFSGTLGGLGGPAGSTQELLVDGLHGYSLIDDPQHPASKDAVLNVVSLLLDRL